MECVFSFGVRSRESFVLSFGLLVLIKNSKPQNFKLFALIKKNEPLILQRYFLWGLWLRKLWILKCRVKPGDEGIYWNKGAQGKCWKQAWFRWYPHLQALCGIKINATFIGVKWEEKCGKLKFFIKPAMKSECLFVGWRNSCTL